MKAGSGSRGLLKRATLIIRQIGSLRLIAMVVVLVLALRALGCRGVCNARVG
jgi:hypothetical protein